MQRNKGKVIKNSSRRTVVRSIRKVRAPIERVDLAFQLDVGLHECVYKWLLSEERSLGLQDVTSMDLSLGQTLSKLQNVVLKKKRLQAETSKGGTSPQQVQVGLRRSWDILCIVMPANSEVPACQEWESSARRCKET